MKEVAAVDGRRKREKSPTELRAEFIGAGGELAKALGRRAANLAREKARQIAGSPGAKQCYKAYAWYNKQIDKLPEKYREPARLVIPVVIGMGTTLGGIGPLALLAYSGATMVASGAAATTIATIGGGALAAGRTLGMRAATRKVGKLGEAALSVIGAREWYQKFSERNPGTAAFLGGASKAGLGIGLGICLAVGGRAAVEAYQAGWFSPGSALADDVPKGFGKDIGDLSGANKGPSAGQRAVVDHLLKEADAIKGIADTLGGDQLGVTPEDPLISGMPNSVISSLVSARGVAEASVASANAETLRQLAIESQGRSEDLHRIMSTSGVSSGVAAEAQVARAKEINLMKNINARQEVLALADPEAHQISQALEKAISETGAARTARNAVEEQLNLEPVRPTLEALRTFLRESFERERQLGSMNDFEAHGISTTRSDLQERIQDLIKKANSERELEIALRADLENRIATAEAVERQAEIDHLTRQAEAEIGTYTVPPAETPPSESAAERAVPPEPQGEPQTQEELRQARIVESQRPGGLWDSDRELDTAGERANQEAVNRYTAEVDKGIEERFAAQEAAMEAERQRILDERAEELAEYEDERVNEFNVHGPVGALQVDLTSSNSLIGQVLGSHSPSIVLSDAQAQTVASVIGEVMQDPELADEMEDIFGDGFPDELPDATDPAEVRRKFRELFSNEDFMERLRTALTSRTYRTAGGYLGDPGAFVDHVHELAKAEMFLL